MFIIFFSSSNNSNDILASYLVDYNSFVFLLFLFILKNMLLHEGSNLQLEKQAHTRTQLAINHSVT